MTSIEVKGLSEEVVERLEKRASANNRSLEDEIRHILEEAVGRDINMAERQAEFQTLARKLRAKTKGHRPSPPAEVIIRHDRDHGHKDGSCDWS